MLINNDADFLLTRMPVIELKMDRCPLTETDNLKQAGSIFMTVKDHTWIYGRFQSVKTPGRRFKFDQGFAPEPGQ